MARGASSYLISILFFRSGRHSRYRKRSGIAAVQEQKSKSRHPKFQTYSMPFICACGASFKDCRQVLLSPHATSKTPEILCLSGGEGFGGMGKAFPYPVDRVWCFARPVRRSRGHGAYGPAGPAGAYSRSVLELALYPPRSPLYALSGHACEGSRSSVIGQLRRTGPHARRSRERTRRGTYIRSSFGR